jgi:hypothetical protein
MAHADAGPSAAKMWMACPASVTLTRGMSRPSSKYALEGSVAHNVCEILLRNEPVPDIIELEGEQFQVDEEMLDCAERYARFIDILRQDADFSSVEKRVSLDWLLIPAKVSERIFGTADFIAYCRSTRTLYIVDFKYGRGVVVEAENNPQPRIYALGALGLPELADVKIDWVRTVIVQPRAGVDAVRYEDLTKEELLSWAEEKFIPAARRVGDGDTTENAGEHCRWCVRAGSCAALYQIATSSAREAFSDDGAADVTPAELSDADLASILVKADLIEDWVKAVREETTRRLEAGRDVPGFKLVAKRATRKWTNLAELDRVLSHDDYGALNHADLYTQPELRSPAQLEKAFKKHGLDFKQLDAFVTKESSGSTLVCSSDPRPQVLSSAALLFSDGTD